MKKALCVIISALIIVCTMSVGFSCFASDTQTTQAQSSEESTRIDLTAEGGKDHTTFWRIFAQFFIEIYYLFVDIIAMAKA